MKHKPTITAACLALHDDVQALAIAAWEMEQQNEPAGYFQNAKMKSLVASYFLATQRFEAAVKEAVAKGNAIDLRPVPLSQFVTRAAIDASYEVRQ